MGVNVVASKGGVAVGDLKEVEKGYDSNGITDQNEAKDGSPIRHMGRSSGTKCPVLSGELLWVVTVCPHIVSREGGLKRSSRYRGWVGQTLKRPRWKEKNVGDKVAARAVRALTRGHLANGRGEQQCGVTQRGTYQETQGKEGRRRVQAHPQAAGNTQTGALCQHGGGQGNVGLLTQIAGVSPMWRGPRPHWVPDIGPPPPNDQAHG